MKKLLKLSRSGFPILKFDLKMKLTTLFIITALFTMQANDSFGQKTKITLNLNNSTVDKVIDKIEETTKFRFIFKMKAVQLDRTISINVKDEKVDKILELLFKGTGTEYKVLNTRVYLTERLKTKGQVSGKIPNSTITIQRSISGTITDQDGVSLPGASVIEKGTTNGTTSDFDGNYSIEVADSDVVLVFSYIGFGTKELNVGTQSTLNVSLKPSAAQLDDVVVIGYGTQKAKNITSAVASIRAEAIKDQPVISFDQAIAGKLAGVQITESSGAPGQGARIRVRGTSSISAGNDPLYVVDGVPINNDQQNAGGVIPRPDGGFSYNNVGIGTNILSSINTNDIQSIEVLKDASAAAIYGSRGSNGVVLITTKKGYLGKPKISYNLYGGIAQVSKKVDLLGAYDFAELVRDGHNNTYLDAIPTGTVNDDNATRTANGSPSGGLIPSFIRPYLEGQQGLTDTDWQDAIFRSAVVQSHNLSVSGGTEKTTFYGSLNYLDQEGVILNTDFEQFSGRLNLHTQVSDKLKIGFNLSPTQESSSRVTNGPWWSEGIVALALAISPNFPVFNLDGSYNFGRNASVIGEAGDSQFPNPVALAQEITNELDHFRFLGNVFANYTITDGLDYRISAGFDLNTFKTNYYRPSTIEDLSFVGIVGGPSIPDAFENVAKFKNWIVEHTLNYNKQLGKHNLDVIAGFSSQKETQETQFIYATNFPNDLIKTTNGGQVVDAQGRREAWSLLSALARLQYNYDDRYLLSAAIRTDGSSRFGENNKWGYVSINFGWMESFQ